MYILDIIRMEGEGVEKARVEGLKSEIQGMGIGAGKRKILRKKVGIERERKVKVRAVRIQGGGTRQPSYQIHSSRFTYFQHTING
jgi:hypothetical protein